MTKKEFLQSVGNGRVDVLQLFLDTLSRLDADHCVIGGLAVNAYAEPVVSLDLDIVVVAERTDDVCRALAGQFKIQRFANSLNFTSADSDLRIQIQTDPRYQDFLSRSKTKSVLGYKMKVASLEDVLSGKLWAYTDTSRRASKRQKDLADILRLAEQRPDLIDRLPDDLKRMLDR
jgi:hypothetical protein